MWQKLRFRRIHVATSILSIAVALTVVERRILAQTDTSSNGEANDSPQDITDAVFNAFVALQDNRSQLGQDAWAGAMRELIELGPEAVPELTTALAETDDEYLMRCVVFALRGIGEKHVIPDLIRAIPKTLQPPASDYGLRCDDPELMKYMQQRDVGFGDDDLDRYSFGRPDTELFYTLKAWTGQDFGFSDVMFVFRQGSHTQQAAQERLFLSAARDWAEWWSEHWQEYVDDPALATVDLPTIQSRVELSQFPTGPNVVAESGMSGVIASVLDETELPSDFPTLSLLDLDTGRFVGWPDSLPPPQQIAGHEAELDAWAAREGVDLMGTQYQPPGSDHTYYILRPFGMRAWQIDTRRYDSVEHDLRNGQVDLGQPIDGFLSHFEGETNTFHPERPAAFLFLTREGTCGALRVVCQVTKKAEIGQPARNDEFGLYFGVRIETKVLYVPESDN